MNLLREIIATAIFIIAILLIVKLAAQGFDVGTLIAMIGCFLVAYFVWPSKRKGQRRDDNSWLDILEFIIELPTDLLFKLLRAIGRLFKGNDNGFDIDL